VTLFWRDEGQTTVAMLLVVSAHKPEHPAARFLDCGKAVRKQAKAQKEPWLLAVSPQLDMLDAKAVVAIYSGRMQIEQGFRDVKNPRCGLGLSTSQTRKPKRLAILLLIAALACYALWLIGFAAKSSGYRIEYGSRKKAGTALSILSLARWWVMENQQVNLSRRRIDAALAWLRVMALGVKI
jgi:hypothetical protein